MKRTLLFMLSCFVVSAQALFAEEVEETYWTYKIDYTYSHNGTTYGYITDNHNIWKLVATGGKGSDLTVGTYAKTPGSEMTFTAECLRDDGKVYPIDFSRKIYSEDKTKTFIVTSFNYFSNRSPNPENCPYKDRLSEFIAPDCTSVNLNTGYTFNQCTSLTNVVLNENFKDLPTGAFGGCSALVNFYPRSFKVCDKINSYVFSGCKKLAGKLSFEACTTVGGSVFNECEALEEVSMPDAGMISGNMFKGCLSLKKVDMPTATSIGERAFEDCEKLSALTVSPNLEEIKSYAFKNCMSLPPDFVNLIARKGLKRFGDNEVFSGCTSLASLIWNFPNLETKVVNSKCFLGCSSLGKVVFKTPVDEIRAYAFYNIKEGAEIYLPKEVPQKFGEWAIGIRKANKDNPVAWPKAFVPDETKDQWLEAIGQTCCYFKKEQFNVSDATVNGTAPKYYGMCVSWAHARAIMELDTDMCTYDTESEKLILKDNRVIGFVFAQQNYNGPECYGCWVLRAPESGFRVIVR